MSEVCMNGTLFPLDWCKRWRGRDQRWQPTRELFNPATFTVERWPRSGTRSVARSKRW